MVALVGLWRASGNDNGTSSGTPTAPVTIESLPEATLPERTTTTTAGTAGEGEVIRRGEVTLGDRDNIDFVDGQVSNGYFGDVILQGTAPDLGNLTTVRVAMAKAVGPTDRAGCVEALNARRVDHLDFAELPAGAWVCLTTEEGNVVALRIIRPVAIGHPKLVFAYTVWP